MAQTRIPMLDLKAQTEVLWPQISAAMERVAKSGQYILGPEVSAFEEEVASYLGAKYAIGVNSGTDALVIALRALGIGPGDEVITTPFTFFATAEAISQVGATPVFVDIDPMTFNINPVLIEKAISPRTRAVIPVHLFGRAADMDKIMQIAQIHELYVIEDTAQAFGAEWQGRKLGTIGDVGCYSFFPTKNLSCLGDGGLIVTNDETLAEKAWMLRAHGSRQKYRNEALGYNSRLDEIQAAVLRVKLPYIDEWNTSRRKVAAMYSQFLFDVPDIVVPSDPGDGSHVFHQYTVRIKNGRRDKIKSVLEEAGISTMVYYPVPVHKLPVYNMPITLQEAELAAAEVLSLPIWPEMKEEAVAEIAKRVRSEVLGVRD